MTGTTPWQEPPDSADLTRYPTNPECAKVLAMLLDYVDGELSELLVAEVTLHVHECRTCALTLGRKEFFSKQLHSAFALDSATFPMAGFGHRAMLRLTQELVLTGDAALTVSGPKPAVHSFFTASRLNSYLARNAKYCALAVLLVVCGLILVRWQTGSLFGIGLSAAHWSVVQSTNSFYYDGDRIVDLEEGQGFGEGARVIVRNGKVVFDFLDSSTNLEQPVAQVTVSSDSEVRLKDGIPLLVDGSMELHSQRALSVSFIDGSQVLLGSGVYYLDLLTERSVDSALRAGAFDTAVQVEVIAGEAAVIVRDRSLWLPDAVVTMGQVARYRGFASVTIESIASSGSTLGAARTGQPAPNPVPAAAPDLVGYAVIQSVGSPPLPLASLIVDYLGESGKRQANLTTDEAGLFALGARSGLKGDWVIIQARPPTGREDLGLVVPQAVRLQLGLTTHILNDAVRFSPAALASGQVVDAEGRALVSVSLVPCLYDNLSGHIQALLNMAIQTDQSGHFELRGLPSKLQQHQSLCLIVFDELHQVAFVPLPGDAQAVQAFTGLQVRLASQRRIGLQNLPANSNCEIYEELLGMPGGCGARRLSIGTDSMGRIAELSVGNGRLWLRGGTPVQPTIRLLAASEADPLIFNYASELPREMATVFRPLSSLLGTSVLLSSESRYQEIIATPITSPELLVIDRGSNRLVANVELFALKNDSANGPSVRFIGIQDSVPVRVSLLPGEQEFLAIGPDGAIARAAAESVMVGGRILPLILVAGGQVEIAPPLRPADGRLMLRLQPAVVPGRSPLPVQFRLVTAADGWRLSGVPAAAYTVLDSEQRTFSITVPANGIVILSSGD